MTRPRAAAAVLGADGPAVPDVGSRALLVAGAALLAVATALFVAAGVADAAPPCEPPEVETAFAGRERFRRVLEDYRETLEGAREALEGERAAALIDRRTYRERFDEYRRAIATYREGIARYRASACRYIDNQILAVRVDEAEPPATDAVVVRVTYYYTGNRGPEIGMQAITFAHGESTGHWAYRPARVGVGLNVAVISLGMNQDAPARYDSNELMIGFFVPRGVVFSERIVPYERTWQRP